MILLKLSESLSVAAKRECIPGPFITYQRMLLSVHSANQEDTNYQALHRWYKRNEVGLRIAIFVACVEFGGSFGPLMVVCSYQEFSNSAHWILNSRRRWQIWAVCGADLHGKLYR